ncbi:hypothetical protein TIFTF001_009395 [Ficus carica]|uniref:Uncharacterized protein n=1 Tax=Ficus carica TaxID=3494 RepID=A0AA87ZWE5_FICCA|nr:hypothetical protein TIFTF001_009395 [Ficus carica]
MIFVLLVFKSIQRSYLLRLGGECQILVLFFTLLRSPAADSARPPTSFVWSTPTPVSAADSARPPGSFVWSALASGSPTANSARPPGSFVCLLGSPTTNGTRPPRSFVWYAASDSARHPGSFVWSAPVLGCVKLNFDASFSTSETALAVVARNDVGSVIATRSTPIFEGDVLGVIDSLSKSKYPNWEVDFITHRVEAPMQDFLSYDFCWVRRTCNVASHTLD